MARRADAEESIELLVAVYQDALTSGSVADIAASALLVAEHGPERRSVGILWEAFDAIGPEAHAWQERLAIGRRVFDIYGRSGDLDGQWRIACRMLLADGTSDDGWSLLYDMLETLGPDDESAWDHAFHTLQGYLEDTDRRLPWDVADDLFAVTRRRPS